jgi:phage tail sheath protein FI
MPEYLAPGVYVEETSFRSKSIEGVSTSTAGFVGPTRYGPIGGTPELITSLDDFRRTYGELDDLTFVADASGGAVSLGRAQPNYLAHAVRAFFEEGGRRLYVSRAFDSERDGNQIDGHAVTDINVNSYAQPALGYGTADAQIGLRARFPGAAGNMRVVFTARATNNIYRPATGSSPATLARARDMDIVLVEPAPGGGDGLFLVRRSATGVIELRGSGAPSLSAITSARSLRFAVGVSRLNPRTGAFIEPAEDLGEYGLDPRREEDALSLRFQQDPPRRLDALTIPFALTGLEGFDTSAPDEVPLALARALFGDLGALLDGVSQASLSYDLAGGNDGFEPDDESYDAGLVVLEALEDISIVAAPGYSASFGTTQDTNDRVFAIQGALVAHAERLKYRIAVLDTPPDQTPSTALEYRNKRSSKYAAMYYPWITVSNPAGEGRIKLPPSGFVAGIYARNDTERAVYKAPANEVVRLAIDFELLLSKGQQELLNPEGLNCFRFFEGRGYLLWGARTISDDPEWKYVNLRRYFIYLEHSIDRGTQWAVFEPNGPALWSNVRRTVEDFLFNEWKMGALLGDKPEQAYFVRCDRSTMTQNDLDNGRMVCLIGLAPVRPAEFVIFRIGQWTATSNQ